VSRKKLLLVVLAVVIATLSGQATALASQGKGGKGGKPVSSTTTTTTSTIPSSADPLLRGLLRTAAQIKAENAKAATLSEAYDEQVVKLKAAHRLVLSCDAQVASAERRVHAAKLKLRNQAILAYVTGQLTNVNSPLLTDDASDGEMAAVYAGSAQNNLMTSLKQFEAITNEINNGRSEAVAAEGEIRVTVARIGALHSQAVRLVKRASLDYLAIDAKLKKQVGQRAFSRLFSISPTGSPYKGKNLAGSDVVKAARPLQALAAAAAARTYLGVPYVFGGAGKKGVDCSGLTMLAWAAAGVSLEHSATVQWEESVPVSLNHLRPGDLLFYHFANDGNTPITHVVMYLGSGPYGAATAIQAAEPGTNVAYTPVYFGGLVSAGRP
jgi:cell wall-associated NlpC family hydrolase